MVKLKSVKTTRWSLLPVLKISTVQQIPELTSLSGAMLGKLPLAKYEIVLKMYLETNERVLSFAISKLGHFQLKNV